MRKFKDDSGREWELALTFGDVLRVKKASDGRFNLLDPNSQLEGRPLQSIVNCDELSDYETLYELLYWLVEPQATDRQITAEQFAKVMTAPALVSAQIALMKEWPDFFRQLQRPEKAAALEKLAGYQALALAKVKAKLNSPELAELDAKVEAKMDATLNATFGALAQSLDLTPAPSPGPKSTTSPQESSETNAP